MAFKRVDDGVDEEFEGFSYENRSGHMDEVLCGANPMSVGIRSNDGSRNEEEVNIWVEDIPLLIKALQAAYDYKRSEKDGYK